MTLQQLKNHFPHLDDTAIASAYLIMRGIFETTDLCNIFGACKNIDEPDEMFYPFVALNQVLQGDGIHLANDGSPFLIFRKPNFVSITYDENEKQFSLLTDAAMNKLVAIK